MFLSPAVWNLYHVDIILVFIHIQLLPEYSLINGRLITSNTASGDDDSMSNVHCIWCLEV